MVDLCDTYDTSHRSLVRTAGNDSDALGRHRHVDSKRLNDMRKPHAVDTERPLCPYIESESWQACIEEGKEVEGYGT